MAVDPATHKAYVANSNDNTVSVIKVDPNIGSYAGLVNRSLSTAFYCYIGVVKRTLFTLPA